MNAQRLFLVLLLQFLVTAPAFAWSFPEDSSQEYRDLRRCDFYHQLPVQSEESKKEGEEEEEEPDCD